MYVDYANGNNVFTTGETIRVENKDVTGKVVYFSNTENGVLVLGELNNLVTANDYVLGDYTNSRYKVISLDLSPLNAAEVIVRPDPANTAPDDQFGFIDEITEWPDTLI
jgi:hypothetical protein